MNTTKSAPETTGQSPDEFFVTGPGLLVSETFNRLVPVPPQPSVAVGTTHIDLIGLADEIDKGKFFKNTFYDMQVEARLGEKHLFENGSLRATLQKFIEKQWNGENGELLNNGSLNLFFTSVCVVEVSRGARYAGWYCDARHRVGGILLSGNRAFSPAD